MVGFVVSPDVGACCPVLPELSGMLSSGLTLVLEPHVGEADPPTSDEGGDEDESQPGGGGVYRFVVNRVCIVLFCSLF